MLSSKVTPSYGNFKTRMKMYAIKHRVGSSNVRRQKPKTYSIIFNVLFLFVIFLAAPDNITVNAIIVKIIINNYYYDCVRLHVCNFTHGFFEIKIT